MPLTFAQYATAADSGLWGSSGGGVLVASTPVAGTGTNVLVRERELMEDCRSVFEGGAVWEHFQFCCRPRAARRGPRSPRGRVKERKEDRVSGGGEPIRRRRTSKGWLGGAQKAPHNFVLGGSCAPARPDQIRSNVSLQKCSWRRTSTSCRL